MPLFSGYIVFAIFQIPVAVAQNVETIMLGRFIGGFAASAPLAVTGGALADIWGPLERAYAICVFASSAFSGPVLGPIVGGFVTESYLGWRWTAWLTLILAALFGGIGLLVVPETSAARILQTRAKRLRYETKNWALHAKADENRITAHTILTVYLMRPFVMLVQEPILALITAYMSFLYGVLYLLFEAVCDLNIHLMHTLTLHSIQLRSTRSAAGVWASVRYPSAHFSWASQEGLVSWRTRPQLTSKEPTSSTAEAYRRNACLP